MHELRGAAGALGRRPGVAVAERARRARLELDARARAACAGCSSPGSEAGVWCGDGGPADGGGDQRPEDGASLCWDTAPLGERLELLGHAAAELELTADRPRRARRRAAVRGRARRQRRR